MADVGGIAADQLRQIVQALLEPLHDGAAVLGERIPRHVHGDKGVAVAVAADP